jgi:hypothetical protein
MPEPRNDADIFDRSFKQIIGSLSDKALITLINALFGADHPLDSEQIGKSLEKQQADEIVSINGFDYIIEQQTTDDANMAIRIFEYDYAHALQNKTKQQRTA